MNERYPIHRNATALPYCHLQSETSALSEYTDLSNPPAINRNTPTQLYQYAALAKTIPKS